MDEPKAEGGYEDVPGGEASQGLQELSIDGSDNLLLSVNIA